MKRTFTKILCAAICLMAFCAFSNAAEGGRVAVVRIQEVFRKSEFAKEMETQIRANFRTEEKEIEDLQKVLRDGRERLQANNLIDQESFAYKEEVMRLQIVELKLRDKMETYAKISRAKMSDFWRNVYKDFQSAIKAIAKSGQYDLIITAPDIDLSESGENSSAPGAIMNEILQRRVQYVSPRVDITNLVLQTMNSIFRKRVNSR